MKNKKLMLSVASLALCASAAIPVAGVFARAQEVPEPTPRTVYESKTDRSAMPDLKGADGKTYRINPDSTAPTADNPELFNYSKTRTVKGGKEIIEEKVIRIQKRKIIRNLDENSGTDTQDHSKLTRDDIRRSYRNGTTAPRGNESDRGIKTGRDPRNPAYRSRNRSNNGQDTVTPNPGATTNNPSDNIKITTPERQDVKITEKEPRRKNLTTPAPTAANLFRPGRKIKRVRPMPMPEPVPTPAPVPSPEPAPVPAPTPTPAG